MNTKLLRRIAKHITEEPRRLDMSGFYYKPRRSFVLDHSAPKVPCYDPAPCGTAACIAGWAVGLELGDVAAMSTAIRPRAEKLLGIDFIQSSRLFFVEYWPKNLSQKYERAATVAEKAKVAVTRINRFIRTKGAE